MVEQRYLGLETPEERLQFCDAYFRAVGAPCVFQSDFYREYELPRDVDKELTDRPYYWLWVEQTGQQVPNTILRLAFNETALERENKRLRDEAWQKFEASHPSEIERMFFRPPTAEWLTLGSFRLQKILESLDIRGRWVCAAEPVTEGAQLIPWLVVNGIISYRCDLVEQRWVSIGVCLVTGQTVVRFTQLLEARTMKPADPHALLRRARVPLMEALRLAQQRLLACAADKPAAWADEARARLQAEMRHVRLYYDSLIRDTDEQDAVVFAAERDRKLAELERTISPRIEVNIVQLGLIGLVQ